RHNAMLRRSTRGEVRSCGLARRAVLRVGAAEPEVAYRATAHRTGLARASVDAHGCQLRRLELVDRDAAPVRYGAAQRGDCRVVESLDVVVAQVRSVLDRRELRCVENLVRVGVADAGKRLLLLQDRLDLLAASAERRREVFAGERRIGR